MTQTTVTVRLAKADKAAFDAFCEETGMTMSTAFNMFVKNVLANQRLPFTAEVKDPFYSPENMARLLSAKERMEKFGGTEHELTEAD